MVLTLRIYFNEPVQSKHSSACPHLTHEVRDDPVEDGPAVTEALLSCTQSTEVLRRSGHDVSEELHHDSPSMLVIHGDVEEHHRVGVSRQRLGGGRLRGVGLRHAALAVCEGLSEGLGQLWSLELSRQLLDLPVSLCVHKHTDVKTAAAERSHPRWINEWMRTVLFEEVKFEFF